MNLAKLLAVPAILLGHLSASAFVAPQCTGQFFNPVSSLDWNNMYPITVAGARTGGGTNPPLMSTMPPVCVCPTIFGIPLPGIGVTYWEPLQMLETENRPGCLSSLGGVSVLPGYSMLTSEMTDDSGGSGQTSRLQVHQYRIPVFSELEMFDAFWCKNMGGYELAYMTELDPTWQDDLWASVFAPESALFANPIAQAACAVDAVAADLDYPMDALFWCSGSWGPNYPLTGNSGHAENGHAQNNQIANKFLARNARLGLEWQTIGPTAICYSHPNPLLVKSQYRYNQTAPYPRKGSPVASGSHGLYQTPPVSNLPTKEYTNTVIWQGKQCCLKIIP